jgi:hypothetical protein
MSNVPTILVQRKLERAAMGLELTFAECAGFVVFDPNETTASYRKDLLTGEESIHVGPLICNLDVPCIEIVLRHELLHRSLYHGYGEQHRHAEISNLALDICINRLLMEAYPEAMRRTATAIYGPEAKKGPIALADPSADPVALPSELAEMWTQIWSKSRGEYAALNPSSIYFRLLRLLEAGLVKPFEVFCKMGAGIEGRPDGRATTAAGRVGRAVTRKLPRGSGLGRDLAQYSVVPMPLGTADIDAFLQKMAVRRVADATATKVLAPLAREVRMQPYPGYPSRTGLVWQMAGISDLLGLYKNQDVSNGGARMAVGLYLDVSGSMIPYFPLVAAFAGALREVPLRLRVFDTSVRELPVEDLAKGKITGGGGTDFDAPIRDFVQAKDLEAGVLFTDGEANVSTGVARSLRASRKRLYVVYFKDRRATSGGVLDRLAKDTIHVAVHQR